MDTGQPNRDLRWRAISEQEIRSWVQHSVANNKVKLDTAFWRYYTAASYVLLRTFGQCWWDKHVTTMPHGYFRSTTLRDIEYDRLAYKVGELAELVFNLQDVRGILDRIDSVKEATGDHLEAGLAELAAGKVFRMNGVPFRFVSETGVRGSDYDIEYVKWDAKIGRCEVKCKLHVNDLSPNGICNTLKSAKSQLPKGAGTGCVMIRTPEEWESPEDIEDTDALRSVYTAVQDFFAREKTKRISSVIVVVHKIFLDGPEAAQILVYREIDNPYCPALSGLILATDDSENPFGSSVPYWRSLMSVIN